MCGSRASDREGLRGATRSTLRIASGELALGFLRHLDDQHVRGGPFHDLRRNEAELVTVGRAESAVPDNNETPVIRGCGIQECIRRVTGHHSSRDIAHPIGCHVLDRTLESIEGSLFAIDFSSSANRNRSGGLQPGVVRRDRVAANGPVTGVGRPGKAVMCRALPDFWPLTAPVPGR